MKQVFKPLAYVISIAALSTGSVSAEEKKDIVDTAVEAGSFKTLAAALGAAGLVDTLKGDGPFTVFAPTDAAFAKLPAGTVEELLKPENKDKLQAILKFHVVSGQVDLSDALKASKANTVLGQPINISFSDGKVRINEASIQTADAKTSNGVIHIIDSVLLPQVPKNNIAADAQKLMLEEVAKNVRTIEGLGLEMIRVSPGTFTLISYSDQSEGDQKALKNSITISKEYWLGRYEVTQGEWEAVMGGNPSKYRGDRRLPVESITWNDAMAFCKKVTEMERKAGRLQEGYEYTLPTEAQWEYASRAGSSEPYAGDVNDVAWWGMNNNHRTHPVGQKQMNAWGFYDMQGNVWERCADWHGEYPAGSATDPTGPSQGTQRVDRGLSWGVSLPGFKQSPRAPGSPDLQFYFLGFRLCLAPVRESAK